MGVVHPGERNPNWRGGRHVAPNGYVKVRVGVGHPLADSGGYAYEHRLVAETKIGRRLAKGEHVHHIDGNKQNNAPENLEVLTSAEHRAEHRKRADLRRPGEPNPDVACACGCGETFSKYDATGRPRRFLPDHNSAVQPAPTRQAVLAVLQAGPTDRRAIVKQTGTPPRAIATCLSKMKRAGLVENVGRGVWRRRIKAQEAH